MAKAGFTLYGARGKVGNLVARKGEKGTVLSEYVQPGNPRTQGQMRVRVAFGTVAKAGAALSDLVGISFQGETSIRGARRRFNALNISKLARQLKLNIADGTVAPKGMSVLIPNKYIVSDGTIRNATLGNVQVVQDRFQVTSHTAQFKYGTEYSVEELLKMLFGVEPGDQITLVGIKAGQPVQYYENELEILRDGQMLSARVYFKDKEDLATLDPVKFEGNTGVFQADIADRVASSIKEAYDPFRLLFENARYYEVTAGEEDSIATVALDASTALGDDTPDLSLILAPANAGIMAFGYFRSHLNSAGTQWMFSRCVLERIDPEYTEETYSQEQNINYGLSYTLALSSYLTKSAIETTRYTETGGSDNTLGF